MRIPYRIYESKDDFTIKINELVKKHLYCQKCFKNTVELRDQPTLLSIFGIEIDKSVYFCYSCNKMVNPLTISEVRDFKIKQINE